MLEDVSRNDITWKGRLLTILLYQTLSNKLWLPFKTICNNPIIVLVVMFILYLLFLIIYIPLWLLSYIMTIYGSYIILIICIHYLALYISRMIAFPGCNASLQKQVSSEFIRRILNYLENLSKSLLDFTATLLLIVNGDISYFQLPSIPMIHDKLQEIVTSSSSLPILSLYLRESILFLSSSMMITSIENKQFMKLCDAIDESQKTLVELKPIAENYLHSLDMRVNNRTYSTSKSSSSSSSLNQVHTQRNPVLIKAITSCMKASEVLRASTDDIRPSSGGDEDTSILSKIKSLLSFTDGVEGCEKISFPYMRCLLMKKLYAQRFTISGANNNKINGVILPASRSPLPSSSSSSLPSSSLMFDSVQSNQSSNQGNHVNSKSGSSNSSSDTANRVVNVTSTSKGIVLFCGPNAGFYECSSQQDTTSSSSSWIGFYLNLGFDVCMYNYRGYGLSTGSPSPASIKEDTGLLYEYIQGTTFCTNYYDIVNVMCYYLMCLLFIHR